MTLASRRLDALTRRAAQLAQGPAWQDAHAAQWRASVLPLVIDALPLVVDAVEREQPLDTWDTDELAALAWLDNCGYWQYLTFQHGGQSLRALYRDNGALFGLAAQELRAQVLLPSAVWTE